jgi:tryptophanyl-tRNA synthetase
MNILDNRRIVSGIRPTGPMHLGHLHGVLKNWLGLQHEYECFFFVADWHALTTHYEDTRVIEPSVWEMVTDWLAVGFDPTKARLFIQSRVPEHAELALLLGMLTPLSWLTRVPSYKDQQEILKERDLATFGFLGYPVLMSADVLAYKAARVPVGEDQLAHLEVTRELARRFNHIFGREPDLEAQAEQAARKMGKRNARLYREYRRRYREHGETEALTEAQALLAAQPNLARTDRERLLGDLEGTGRVVLIEPEPLLTRAARVPGLDGRKMSKSYGNTIGLREQPEAIERKIRTMQTDPARVRRSDPGEPEKCPVWGLHKIYSDEDTQNWVQWGCRNAGIGCLDCKQPVIDGVLAELAPIRERAAELAARPETVREAIDAGSAAAREVAKETLDEVRQVMGLKYR